MTPVDHDPTELKHIIVSLGPHGFWATDEHHAIQQFCDMIGYSSSFVGIFEEILVTQVKPTGPNVMVLGGSWDGLWENHRLLMQQLQDFTTICNRTSDEGTDVGHLDAIEGPATTWIFPTAADAEYARTICRRHGLEPLT